MMRVLMAGVIASLGAQIEGNQCDKDNARDQIKPARVIPSDVRMRNGAGRSRSLWDEVERVEDEVYQNSSGDHADIKDHRDVSSGSRAVILRVNEDERNHDQIAVDERNHATETDAVRPEQARERDIAD